MNEKKFGWFVYLLKLPLRLLKENYKKTKFSLTNKEFLLNIDKLKKHKKSDKLFILGSSWSINNLTGEQWNEIKDNDSFGINNWLLTGFIPSFYMVEPDQDINIHNKQVGLVESMIPELKDTIVLFKDTESSRHNDFAKLYNSVNGSVFFKRSFFCSTNEEFCKAFKLFKALNFLKEDDVYFVRASVFTALYIGYLLNYKEIIFVGVDLNSVEYFYDDLNVIDTKLHKYIPNKIYVGKNKNIRHSTADSSVNGLTVDFLIKSFSALALKPKGIKVSVINNCSILYPDIPLYEH